MATADPPAPLIVAFYDPKHHAVDDEGRSLNTILDFSNTQLERYHDYIQVLFPLPERSPINRYAPIITKEIHDAFLARSELQEQLTRAFERMLRFYGFTVSQTGNSESTADYPDEERTKLLFQQSQTGGVTLDQGSDYEQRSRASWRKGFDHNHLRITRIIRCLRILGLQTLALAFYHALTTNESGKVSARTLHFWRRAAERPLYLAPEDDDDAPGVAWLRPNEDEEEES